MPLDFRARKDLSSRTWQSEYHAYAGELMVGRIVPHAMSNNREVWSWSLQSVPVFHLAGEHCGGQESDLDLAKQQLQAGWEAWLRSVGAPI